MVVRQLLMMLRRNLMVLRHMSRRGDRFPWRWIELLLRVRLSTFWLFRRTCWCGNQNDDGVGAAMDGVEANIGGVETNFGGVETSFDRVQAF